MSWLPEDKCWVLIREFKKEKQEILAASAALETGRET